MKQMMIIKQIEPNFPKLENVGVMVENLPRLWPVSKWIQGW